MESDNMWGNIFKYENELTVSGLNNSLINEYILNYYENLFSHNRSFRK